MLSIIIPTYNEEKLLPELLGSVREQNYKDYELIVADADSTDQTAAIARSFGAEVVRGGMPGAGRNAGARVARGEVFLFLDADAKLGDPDFLTSVLHEFQDRKLDLATCRLVSPHAPWIDRAYLWGYHTYITLVRPWIPHAAGSCLLVKRETHARIGGFDETIMLAEDQDYARRISEIGQFDFLRSRDMLFSTRRFDHEGRVKFGLTYLGLELHLILFGSVRTNIFNYRFGYDAGK